MKYLIMIILSLFLALGQAQQTSPGVKSTTEAQTVQSLTKTATKTTLLYKGLAVYKSANGKYFAVQQSKKTGNYYKHYLEVSKL